MTLLSDTAIKTSDQSLESYSAPAQALTKNSSATTATISDKIIGSSTSFEVYEPFRNLLTNRENEFNMMSSYFTEKLNIENSCLKANERLLKKYSTLSLSNGKSTSLALSSFMDFNTAQHEERIRYRDQIAEVTQNLDTLKKANDNSSKQIKEVVKPVARKYTDMASIHIPKEKIACCKKLEAWEKEASDTGNSGQKIFKLNREVELADSSYRTAIVELEEIRITLEQVKQKASTMWELMERQRGEFLSSCFKSLSSSLNDSHSRLLEKLQLFAESTSNISCEEDCKLAADYFQLAFPEREPILFEHYKTKELAKDLVFRVSLDHVLRTSSKNGIPLLLYYCFEAIESRGIEKEGIYRLSCKKNELLELKIMAETNVHSVPYMSEDIDIHLLSSLVKSYLREMPTPIFLFSTKDRVDYSANPNAEERIKKLIIKIDALSKNNRKLLESIIFHLHKVYLKSSLNKMTIPNLSMIFSAVLFQGQEQAAPEPSSMTSMFFGKPVIADVNALEMLKNDLVIEDLIKYSDQIFNGASFTPWVEGPISLMSSSSIRSNTRQPIYSKELEEVKKTLPYLPSENKNHRKTYSCIPTSLEILNVPTAATENITTAEKTPTDELRVSATAAVASDHSRTISQLSANSTGAPSHPKGSRSFFVKLSAGLTSKSNEKKSKAERSQSNENLYSSEKKGNDEGSSYEKKVAKSYSVNEKKNSIASTNSYEKLYLSTASIPTTIKEVARKDSSSEILDPDSTVKKKNSRKKFMGFKNSKDDIQDSSKPKETKDFKMNIFKKKDSIVDLKSDNPHSVEISRPVLSPGQEKSIISGPISLAPFESQTNSASLSSFFEEFMSEFSSTACPSLNLKRRIARKKKPVQVEQNSDDDIDIDQSLFDDVNANIYDMDSEDNEDYDRQD